MTSKKEKRQAVFNDDLPLSLYKTNSNLSFQKGKGAIDYFLASIWCPNFTACATVAATKATTTNVNITKTFLLNCYPLYISLLDNAKLQPFRCVRKQFDIKHTFYPFFIDRGQRL